MSVIPFVSSVDRRAAMERAYRTAGEMALDVVRETSEAGPADMLEAAARALRSYQYGNEAPELAHAAVEACHKVFLIVAARADAASVYYWLSVLGMAREALRRIEAGGVTPDTARAVAFACDVAVARLGGWA